MKTLEQYVKESLLDDIDDLEKSSDDSVNNTLTNDPNFIHLFGEGWTIKGNSIISPETKPFKYKGSPSLMIVPNSDIKSFLPKNINEMIINFQSFDIINKSYGGRAEISKHTLYDKIVHNGGGTFVINGRYIKDIDFDLNSYKLTLPYDIWQCEFDNVNINFRKSGTISIGSSEFPKFNNVKSNAINMIMYSASIFDNEESIKSMDNILDLPYNVKVYDANKKTDVDVTIKSFKKIHAIINNKKRYSPREPLIKIKKNASLNDVLDLSGFKDLTYLTIGNYLINITLTRGNMIKTHSRFWHKDNQKFEIGDWVGYIKKI